MPLTKVLCTQQWAAPAARGLPSLIWTKGLMQIRGQDGVYNCVFILPLESVWKLTRFWIITLIWWLMGALHRCIMFRGWMEDVCPQSADSPTKVTFRFSGIIGRDAPSSYQWFTVVSPTRLNHTLALKGYQPKAKSEIWDHLRSLMYFGIINNVDIYPRIIFFLRLQL